MYWKLPYVSGTAIGIGDETVNEKDSACPREVNFLGELAKWLRNLEGIIKIPEHGQKY